MPAPTRRPGNYPAHPLEMWNRCLQEKWTPPAVAVGAFNRTGRGVRALRIMRSKLDVVKHDPNRWSSGIEWVHVWQKVELVAARQNNCQASWCPSNIRTRHLPRWSVAGSRQSNWPVRRASLLPQKNGAG
jgi:hypothetical protein